MATPRPSLQATRSSIDEVPTDLDRDGGPRGRLRIGLVAPPVVKIPPERYAGTERIVGVLADGLVRRGHHVTLFASGDSTAGSEVVPVTPKAAWIDHWTGDNPSLALLSAMTALAHAREFDILHSHVDSMSLALVRQSPVPVVTTFHSRLDVPGVYEAVRGFGDAPLVAISRSQRRWHPEGNWVATIPHGLPFDDVPFSARAGDYLVVVGRASPDKGVREAIEVANAVRMPLRIAIKATDQAEHDYVRRFITPALCERIRNLGEIGPSERDLFLAAPPATLMLGAWPEPFGLVAIESLATGTPVIARRAGALPEIVEHGVDGFLIDDPSEARLAVRLAETLDRTRIRARALERFGVERMIDAYERLYRTLIEEHGRRTGAGAGARSAEPDRSNGHHGGDRDGDGDGRAAAAGIAATRPLTIERTAQREAAPVAGGRPIS
jgi:glycosyltransferase involved in cell wall biosynthesis